MEAVPSLWRSLLLFSEVDCGKIANFVGVFRHTSAVASAASVTRENKLPMEKPKLFERTYFLTPAECTPQGRMPITLLINRLIEVATLHANEIGIGYASLAPRGETWVLSRVAVEMRLYPGVNDHYTIRTWVSGVNRFFSERDFEILDANGATIGYARTVWAVLNVTTRAGADISHMQWVSDLIPEGVECPIEKPARLRAVEPDSVQRYRFTYCDIDFNRHVNSSRYIELLLNQWSLDYHDRNRLNRFEIAYMHEAYFDEEVEVCLALDNEATTRAELIDVESRKPLCRALLRFGAR